MVMSKISSDLLVLSTCLNKVVLLTIYSNEAIGIWRGRSDEKVANVESRILRIIVHHGNNRL